MRRARTPTRVSNACARCRRQKQRCDEFRPCSNCLHIGSECEDSELPPAIKRPRLPRKGDSLDFRATEQRRLAPSFREKHEDSVFGSVTQPPQTDQHPRRSSIQRDPSSNGGHGSRREQSVLADLGGSESAMDITKKILGYASSPKATFAIPGGDSNRVMGYASTDRNSLLISQILRLDLPSRQVSDALVDTYFYTVHWFSLVIYEPKFRSRYTSLMDRGQASPADRAFLLLLLMVMVMGCWYGPGVLDADIASTAELADMRRTYLASVSQNFMDLIDEDCLEFVQLCALLGSYWLYWGRPRSAFSILGAATKSAQALGLHRDSDKHLSPRDAEERKRVWWTIYTWDRFATIVYGRPLGINDKDCNVAMPASYAEDVNFAAAQSPARVCLSPYQIQLNRVYQITSPLLENIYGIRYSTDRSLRSQMPGMISKIDQLMCSWQEELPPHLHLDQHDDINLGSSVEEKMHRLQGLALQLTYDNLMIVIHRPLLADQSLEHSQGTHTEQQRPIPPPTPPVRSQNADSTYGISFGRCLAAALRISRLQQTKRHLLALARRTHLVSFIGMNLFTASVVMFICALSDTLSDVAQEAKRGMARNLKMLKLLSGDGSLSMQCSIILEDLVQKIVDREKEEMLCSLPSDGERVPFLPTYKSFYNHGQHHHPDAVTGEVSGSHPSSWRTSDEHGRFYEEVDETYPKDNGFTLQQTMASLQKVFKEVATPQPQFPPTGFDSERSHLKNFPHGPAQPVPWAEPKGENSGFTFDGSNFNTEDLGQFWLWDMDPHVEYTPADDATQEVS